MSKEKHVLNVMARETFGKGASRRARRDGKVPAVIYGHGAEPQQFLLDNKEWGIISKQDIQIVELKLEKGKPLNALIKEVQFDYLSGTTTHIDFLEVKMDEVITAQIPIHSHGTPIGLSQGGVMDQPMHEIEVSCTPLTLPESIEVDVTDLELDSSIHVSDLVMPEGVTALAEADQTVFSVMLPRIQEEEEEEAVEGEEGIEGAVEGAEGDAEAGGEKAGEE